MRGLLTDRLLLESSESDRPSHPLSLQVQRVESKRLNFLAGQPLSINRRWTCLRSIVYRVDQAGLNCSWLLEYAPQQEDRLLALSLAQDPPHGGQIRVSELFLEVHALDLEGLAL